MKKHLIAAAVAAAVAVPAAAQVTLSGALEAGYTSKDVRALGSTTSTTRHSSISGGHVTTPAINFAGSEDLGGGLKASFLIQSEFDTATGSEDVTNSVAKFSQTTVSLSGGFGTISVGNMNHATRDLGGMYRFFGDIGRLAASMNSSNNLPNTIQFVSPTFSGFSLSAASSSVGKTVDSTTGATTGVNPVSNNSVGLRGSIGKVNVALAIEEENFIGASAAALRGKMELTTFGVTTDLGMARLGLVYADQESTSAAQANGGERNALGVHARVPVSGAVAVGGSFTSYEVTPAGGGAKPKADIMTVAAQYTLSKRTSIYASYQQVKNSGAANALSSANPTSINSGTVRGSRGLGVVETTNTTASGMGLTVVHSF